MKIVIDSGIDASAVDRELTANTDASVNITRTSSGITGYCNLQFNSLTSNSANFNFDIGWAFPSTWFDFASIGPVPGPLPGEPPMNSGGFIYHADGDMVLDYAWDFDYSGSFNFGLGSVTVLGFNLTQNLFTFINPLGDHILGGNFMGMNSANLLARDDYLFAVTFFPNTSVPGCDPLICGDPSFDARLHGDVSFNITSVPEPASLFLMSLGLAGFGFARRNKVTY